MDDFKPQQPQQPNEPTDKPDDFQATYENKPETYVTPAGEPTTLNTVPQPSLEIPKKKKSGAKKWLLGGLVVLLLAGLGAFAYWQWSEAESAKKELSSAQSQLETAQSDLAKANTDIGKPDEPVASTPTDKELVTQEVTAHVRAAVLTKDTKPVVNVMKLGSEFAYVNAGMPEGGGKRYILKKVDNIWTVIESGNDTLSEDVIKTYGIPEEYQTGQ